MASIAIDGRHADAVRHLRQYTQMRPDDLNVIRAYNLMGRSQLSLGALDDAASSFREVLRMQPRNLDALAWLGETRLGQGRLEEAIDAFGSAAALAPGNAGLHMNLANSLVTAGRIDEAISACRRALAVEPDAAARQEIANVISQLELERPLGPKQRGASR